MILSNRAKGLKPSPTLSLASKSSELKAQGHDVISLSLGEPDWETFSSAKKAGLASIEEGDTKYTPSNGIPELRKAIAKQVSEDFGVDYTLNQVTVTTGGKFSLFSAFQVLLDPGDEVLIPAPYWVSYPVMVELAGALPRVISCNEACGFKLTPESLRENINPKTKLLILNSPSNPTGCMYTKEELAALAQVLKEHPHVLIISDDIYNRLVFNEEGLAPHILQADPSLVDRTIIVNGASKTYSMTGWRVGWALGPEIVISAMTKFQSQSVSCASPFAQKATLQAIENSQEDLNKALKLLKSRRDFVHSKMNDIPGMSMVAPQGAFYVWPCIKKYLGKVFEGEKLKNSRDFSQALLKDQMVVVVPGMDFGLDGYLRISYVLSEERMAEAVKRIATFVGKLKDK